MKKIFKISSLCLVFCFFSKNICFAEVKDKVNFDVSNPKAQVDISLKSSEYDFKAFKEKAIKENKILDITKYEQELSKSKTVEEKQNFYNSIKNFIVEETVQYMTNDREKNLTNTKSFSTYSPKVGDTRIITDTYYAGSTTWDQKSASSLNLLASNLISIVVGLNYTVTGAFMSIINLYVPPYDFETYKNVIVRTLYDYKISVKHVEVYQFDGLSNYYFAPMASSEFRQTNAQLNTVYYKNDVRNIQNLDLGLIKEEYGTYYSDESKLTQMAKSTLTPLYWSYNTGGSISYDKSYLLKYN